MKYVFSHTKLTGDGTELIAHAVDVPTLGLDDLIKYMGKIDPETGGDTARSVLLTLKKAVCAIVANGKAVRVDLFTARPTISGKVKDAALITSASLKTKVSLSPGPDLVKAAANIPLELDSSRPVGPHITRVFTTSPKSPRVILKPGKLMTIRGVDIKVEGKDESVGVYFTNIDTGAVTKAAPDDVGQNSGGTVVVVIPASLVRGKYLAQIVTQFTGSASQRIPPITITCDTPLIVE